MNRLLYIFFFLVLLAALPACQTGSSRNLDKPNALADPKQFADYWYQGKAELTSFSLEQARYGELHQGESVLIFVTEDFSKQKQVKLDDPQANRNDAVNVLKLNMTKKFNTGIYPYSMMLSVFTPVQMEQYPMALKATASVQEWCGHTFSQLNLRNKRYHYTLHSYFESEGEKDELLDAALPEDELWTRIRLNPQSLPQGNVTLIPSLLAQRLRHTELQSRPATASLKNVSASETPQWLTDAGNTMRYRVQYPDEQRTIAIYFEEAFPHRILGWEETYPDGAGANAPLLTTRAVRKKELITDYWTKNKKDFAYLRDSLDVGGSF